MKTILLAVMLMGCGAMVNEANALMPVAETVQSTAIVSGVSVSTSSPSRVDTTWVNGKNRAWARVQNQDSTGNVYCGFDTAVSTSSVGTQAAKLGEKLAPLGSAVYNVGRDIKIYCQSDAASATYVSVSQYGY